MCSCLYVNYVLVPAYKAVNITELACLKCYIEVLRSDIHSSKTFQATNLTEQQIANKHMNVPTMY